MKKLFGLLVAVLMLSVLSFATQEKKVFIDNDVGICMSLDVENTNTLIVEKIAVQDNLVTYKMVNYQEVGIMPLLNVILVSNDKTNKFYDETLQGNIYLINSTERIQFVNAYNEGKVTINPNTSTYNIQNSKVTNSHFRLDRSRCVLQGKA